MQTMSQYTSDVTAVHKKLIHVGFALTLQKALIILMYNMKRVYGCNIAKRPIYTLFICLPLQAFMYCMFRTLFQEYYHKLWILISPFSLVSPENLHYIKLTKWHLVAPCSQGFHSNSSVNSPTNSWLFHHRLPISYHLWKGLARTQLVG